MRHLVRGLALGAAIGAPGAAQQSGATEGALLRQLLDEAGRPDASGELRLPGEPQGPARAPEERTIRESFERAGIAEAELSGVACEGARCVVSARIAAAVEPVAVPGRLADLERWIAATSPCGYAMTAAPDDGGGLALRAAIDCGG